MNILAWLDDEHLQPAAADSLHFGDPSGEAHAALHETIIAPLPHLGTLGVSGADTVSFLQGQLSSDVRELNAGQAQLSSWNSAKGRALAIFTAWQDGGDILLETRAELLDGLLKRLRLFVLRAQVKLDDRSGVLPAFGLSGAAAPAQLQAAGLPVPEQNWQRCTAGELSVLRRPGAQPRYTLHAPPARLATLWKHWRPSLRAVGVPAWRLLDIHAGLPGVVAATQDHFVPQMLNLDQLGGISFTKGCYVGQEIVARLHYRGTLKRQLYGSHSSAAVAPGAAVINTAGDAQAVGEIVDCAAEADGCYAVLLVLQNTLATAESLQVSGDLPIPLQQPVSFF